jgi:hypothetical protein
MFSVRSNDVIGNASALGGLNHCYNSKTAVDSRQKLLSRLPHPSEKKNAASDQQRDAK